MGNKLHNISLLALSTFGIWVRAPQLISYPRFWAEEGSRFFSYALEHGFWSTLIFLDPRAGYLDVTVRLSAVLASVVPLMYAPHVTTYIAYSLQLFACFIIIYGHSPIFDNYSRKALGCIIVLFAGSIVDEVWLNTTNLSTWYGLIGFLIAVDRLSLISRPLVIFYRIVLTVGALSGPYVCMLAPVYGLIAIRERTRDAVINVGLVFGGLAAHGLVLFHFMFLGSLNEKRFQGINFLDATNSVFWNHIAKPIFGAEYPVRVLLDFVASPYFGTRLIVVLALFILSGLAIVQLAFLPKSRFTYTPAALAIASWFCISVGTVISSFNSALIGRYSVLPGWIILFVLLNFARPVRLKLAGLFSICLLILTLGISLMNYSLGERTDCDGRAWRDEVRAYGLNQKVLQTDKEHVNFDRIQAYVVPICPQGFSIEFPLIQEEE